VERVDFDTARSICGETRAAPAICRRLAAGCPCVV